ncbi:hypothetical protein BDV96DRAFT_201605 [Lophiotrema nucula]|uniref:Uncharacterized protein n=1 Tax=Lophiotrema nucula TaxID=690887 RepID=A0A6A5YTX9_9PLEO|nr:hypothetical protein BDV96DRAFT_201605 [Lophiotrema nucula]
MVERLLLALFEGGSIQYGQSFLQNYSPLQHERMARRSRRFGCTSKDTTLFSSLLAFACILRTWLGRSITTIMHMPGALRNIQPYPSSLKVRWYLVGGDLLGDIWGVGSWSSGMPWWYGDVNDQLGSGIWRNLPGEQHECTIISEIPKID